MAVMRVTKGRDGPVGRWRRVREGRMDVVRDLDGRQGGTGWKACGMVAIRGGESCCGCEGVSGIVVARVDGRGDEGG